MKDHTNKLENKRVLKRAAVLIAAIVTAIAVFVACALFTDFSPAVEVDGVQSGEVSQSTTYSNRTGDLSAAGAIKNGDVLNYAYTGSVVSVRLPKGTYSITMYGGAGGNASGYTGGKGGVSSGRFTVSASAEWFYMAIGGQGGTTINNTSYYAPGGWNGGGRGYPSGGNTSHTQTSGGGGGATHIATTNRGVLSNYNSYRSEVLMVAGGGGGAGAWYGTSTQRSNGGAGGGTSGGTATNGVPTSAAGGTQTSGYAFGQGGSGVHADQGGGGGGWWGGRAQTGTSDNNISGGGGGSGYINTSRITSGSTSTQSSVSGNGKITINVISVNQGPVSQNKTIQNASAATYYRGTSRNIDIAASTIAQDDDYANTSGATRNSVYYSNGSSSNYDALPAANAGLYLNSACTTSASPYLSWTWVNNQTLRITEIKKYPRSGVDGCTQNGRLTLYVKMRDQFGTSTTRGTSTVLFYLVVNDRPITPLDGTKTYSYTANGKAYEYRYGDSTSADASANFIGTPNSIYNPNHKDSAKVKTVFLPKPIAPTDTSGYTIYAKDIFGDGDTAYDYVGFRTVTPLAGYTQYSNYYSISYNADGNYASGVVPSITIKPSNIRPNGAVYVCATITAQTSEKSTKVAIGSQNTTVQLVFRLANTRPYFASSSAIDTGLEEPVITLNPSDPNARSKTLNIASMIKDIDDASLSAYFARGANDLKVPVNEYIQVDMSNIVVPLKTNVGSNYAGKTQAVTTGDSSKLSSKTGEGNTPTGFVQGVIAAEGSSAAANAAVTYSYDSDKVIRFTARAATQYMYSTPGRAGDFYIMVRVVDPSDATDDGIWYPIAIKVESSAPAETPTVANFDLKFETGIAGNLTSSFKPGSPVTTGNAGSDAQMTESNYTVLTPISYVDASGNVVGVGTTSKEFNKETGHAAPFVVDPDTFMFDGEGVPQTRPLNDVVMLAGTTKNSALELYDTSEFFDVDLISLYADRNVFSKLNMTTDQLRSFGVREYSGENSASGYEFYGLKITPKRSTNGEYFQFGVKVTDSHGTPSTVRVLVNVENRAVQARRGSYKDGDGNLVSIDTNYPINTAETGEFTLNRSIGAVAVNYKIERNDVIQITPYDLAYDFDIDENNSVMNVLGKFNTNPSDEDFKKVSDFVNKTYNIPHTSSVNSPAAAPSAVNMQTLNFINVDNFNANAAQYSGYIDASINRTCVVGDAEYAVPCIRITGKSRTTSAVVQLRFTISDGYSNIDCVVTVTVNNSAPVLNTVANHPKENDNDFRVSEPYTMTAEIGSRNYLNAYNFTARNLAYDKDGDTPTFIAGSARIVAYDKEQDGYFEMLTAGYKGTANAGEAAYRLSDYVQTMFAKNEVGEDVVNVRALSSTELFPLPIYLEVRVQDGFRAQPEYATLRVLINVRNSAPVFVTDNLANFRDDDYSWEISYENKSELKVPRYIFNSKELHDSSDVEGVRAAAANKTYLFDDADAMQNAMLNPSEWYSASGNNPVGKLVMKTAGVGENNRVDENAFNTGDGINAAVIYTAMYSGEVDEENQYLNIEVLFFVREVNANTGAVSFKALEYTDPRIKTAQYWALRITDKSTSDKTALYVNIAIAVKDDHHGNDVYNAQKTSSQKGTSNREVFNLFYHYRAPGIKAMHTYYRTDGNAEASEIISGEEGKDAVYAVQLQGFDTDSTNFFVGARPSDQAGLRTAEFTEKFKYAYFVKTLTRTAEGEKDTEVEVTYKHFPASSNAFYYEPIQVGASGLSATTIPMSYIAMPKASEGRTDGAGYTHVTFANATSDDVLQPGTKLLDKQYLDWVDDAAAQKAIFENLTLTDSSGEKWTGDKLNDNPYIKISYTANSKLLNSTKVNQNYFKLTSTVGSSIIGREPIRSIENSNSMYREDKYGFIFEKKVEGKRSTDSLKLTLALKTTSRTESNKSDDSAVEYVDVDIQLSNSAPQVTYTYPGASNPTSLNGYINNLDISMKTSDIAGKTVALVKSGNTDKIGDYELNYTDPDSTDTMRFLLSSATGTMSEQERKYITSGSNTNGATEAIRSYYCVSESDGSYELDGETLSSFDEYKEKYVPNPGYDKFFDITPNDGTSATLQFIPKAKTQLSIPDGTTADKKKEILGKYHLEEDNNGKIYYPFRVLFYDDIDGSPITEGNWCAAIIRVYINNDEMSVNKNIVTDIYDEYNDYYGLPNYRFKLSKNTDFFVDVSSLLVDNDIMLDGASFAVKTDDTWSEEDRLFKDYLVMPDGYVRISPEDGELPVTVKKPDADSGMPESTLCFNADSAFGGSIDLLYTFDDSVHYVTTGNKRDNAVGIVFSIEYNNEKPTANAITFNGSESLNITMKTGEYFTLYAVDSNDFIGDVNGGFLSYNAAGTGYVQKPVAYITEHTNDLYKNFVFNSTTPGVTLVNKNLGSLIVGNDDAPSTLRIGNWQTFENPDDVDKFEITEGTRYRSEYNTSLPMSVTLKARGVTNAVYKLTLADGNRETVTINININVVSTAPTVTDGLLPRGLTRVEGEENTFAVSLEYGESKEFEIGGSYNNGFMTDIDAGDVNSLSVYKNVDNTKYTIINPQGISAVQVTDMQINASNAIMLTATDFVPNASEDVSVQFRIADEHGAVSDTITFKITIKPREVGVVATQNKNYKETLKSYAEYELDGQPVSIDLVALAGDATIFSDADVNAPSARYDVRVYALLKKNDNGTFSTIRQNSDDFDPDACKIVSLTNSSLSSEQSDIADYVARFFTISVSANGKVLEFTPNSATISTESNNASLADIKLYIELAKRYSSGDRLTMDQKQAYMDVSVKNSALVAVPSSPVNSGYPMVTVGEDEERLRESAFLEFSGSAGDNLTWDLYNLNEPELGLFYDYDLINNPAVKVDGRDVGGLETITFVRAEFSGIPEADSRAGKGDVLSVNLSGDGKKLTVKINRKVFTGQPPKEGNKVSFTDVKVDIYCADTIGKRSGITNVNNLVKTTITVRVENDIPEIKEVVDPAVVSKVGYTVTYSDVDGYVLDARLARGASLNVNIVDIIADADIDMDEYVLLYTGSDNSLLTSTGDLMGSTDVDGTKSDVGKIKNGNSTLFSVRLGTSSNAYSVSTMSRLIFTCESTERGAVGTCQVRFRDSVQGAVTRILTINLTVDNIAPSLKPGANTSLTLMGVGENGTPEDANKAAKSYSILDFITDANGDDYVATDPEYAEKLPTYTFIDSIFMYSVGDPVNAPIIFGPNAKGFEKNQDGTLVDPPKEFIQPNVCRVEWSVSDLKYQSFTIIPIAGVYGEQKVILTIIDSGYDDGSSAGVLDGKSYELTLTITVANPLEDVDDILPEKSIAYGVTKEITIEELLGDENSKGYTIDSITEKGSSSLRIYAPGEAATRTSASGDDNDGWRIYAATEGVTVNTEVTFRAGDVTRVKTLPIRVSTNTAPAYKEDGAGPKTSYEYTLSMLNIDTKTIKIYPEDWFTDIDEGDVMTFVNPITTSQSAIVEVLLDYDTAAEGGRSFITLKFNYRGEANITLNVSDSSGRLYERTITVNCTDAPEPSWWANVVSLIEANWMWFWIIVGCVLLFIILLIVIIVVVHKKRKMRREIEALLNAESELEEEMMRLGSGGMTPYQSFGYLPPTQATVNDPNLMLGGSANNPTPNSLQLNAGTGAPNAAPPQNSTPGSIPPPDNGDGFNPDDF